MTTEILVVCHANIGRSPMAAVLLEQRLRARGVADLLVGSAGVLRDGDTASPHSVSTMHRRGLDLATHRSRRLQPAFVADADLVVGMEREQVREAILCAPEAWSRCFTLKELVRRGEAVGPRPAGASLTTWIARVHEGRNRRDLLGASPLDDLTDPTGGTLAEHEDTARELEDLLEQLVNLAWPHARPAEPPSAP